MFFFNAKESYCVNGWWWSDRSGALAVTWPFFSMCTWRFWGTTQSSSVWRRSCKTRLTSTSTSTPPFSKPTSEVGEALVCHVLFACRREQWPTVCASAVVGGLLSAHLLAGRAGMELEPGWPCAGPLLRMAEDAARKLLPGTNQSVQFGFISSRISYCSQWPLLYHPCTANNKTRKKTLKKRK